MLETFQVLIVEDDFRIAEINRQFVNRVDGFTVLDVVKTGEEALAYLRNKTPLPQLILLDVYIPDTEGLRLFWQLRTEFKEIDVIMVTAAREVTTIAEALSGAIFDYIVKPAVFERFERALNRFRYQRLLLSSVEELSQEEIDSLLGFPVISSPDSKVEGQLPKGIDQITLNKIRNALSNGGEAGMTALNAGQNIGVSRSTARRYLEYLVSEKEAIAQLKYGDIGRPERKYTPWTI